MESPAPSHTPSQLFHRNFSQLHEAAQQARFLLHIPAPQPTPPLKLHPEYIEILDSPPRTIDIPEDSPEISHYALQVAERPNIPPATAEDILQFTLAGVEWTHRFPWSPRVSELNASVFKNTEFRPMQEAAINAVLSNRDVFICMPTGGGKSLIYQLPALFGPGVTLVVMPLISLIRDQSQRVKSAKIKYCAFASGMPAREEFESFDKFESDPDVSLVFLTPEKLAKSGRTQAIVEKLNAQGRLTRIIIDEAHCVSKWGRSFREDYLNLSRLRAKFPTVPIVAMTATATERVKLDIGRILGMREIVEFRTSCNRPNLIYSVKAKSGDELREIGTYILRDHANHTGLIYCLSIKDTESVAWQLKTVYKLSIEHYHAKMKQADRIKVEKKWRSGEVRILSSTIAFGMGIDKPDVRFVIHHSLPMSLDNYSQESGRAGRDGRPSDCILYYSQNDKRRNQFLIRESIKGTDETFGMQMSLLEIMVDYCEEKLECRKDMLMKYFGEKVHGGKCGRQCDNCCSNNETTTKDMTDHAKSMLQLISQSTFWGLTDLISKMEKSSDLSQSDLSAWQTIKMLNKYELETLFRKMFASCVIEFSGTKFSSCLVPGPNSESLTTGKLSFVIAFDKGTHADRNAPLHCSSSFPRVRKPSPPPQLSTESKQQLRTLLLTLRLKMIACCRKNFKGTIPTPADIDVICERLPMSLTEARAIGFDLCMRFIKEIRVFVKANRIRRAKQNAKVVNLEEDEKPSSDEEVL